jgi:predicted kinase
MRAPPCRGGCLDIEPNEVQGRVVPAALKEARQYLRAKGPFVWNATNVSRLNRDRATGLCLEYDARVEIHALDRPPERLFAQNRQHGAVVPARVLDRLIAKWEPPSLTKAHVVKWGD